MKFKAVFKYLDRKITCYYDAPKDCGDYRIELPEPMATACYTVEIQVEEQCKLKSE